MYPVSERFLSALRRSHTSVQRCDLLRQGQMLASDIPMAGGTIIDDTEAVVRRRCSVILPAIPDIMDLLPSEVPVEGGLWPLGNELKVYSGIAFEDGTEEMVPMGVFRISRPQLMESERDAQITIDGYDRSRAVDRFRFVHPYTVAQGTNYATAIKDLILSRLPWLDPDDDFRFMETNYSTPNLVFNMDDHPMEVAHNMASSIGAELFFDGDGVCVLRPEPDPAYTEPVFRYEEGAEATITKVGRDLDDEQSYNGVVVTAENSELEPPIRAEAWDTNPDSPTYYDPDRPGDSVYGAVPYFMSSQYITTQQQAQDAAYANVSRVTGVIEAVNFEAVANPAHEGGDVITVVRQSMEVMGTYVLSTFEINFGDIVTMSGMTRRRRAS